MMKFCLGIRLHNTENMIFFFKYYIKPVEIQEDETENLSSTHMSGKSLIFTYSRNTGTFHQHWNRFMFKGLSVLT